MLRGWRIEFVALFYTTGKVLHKRGVRFIILYSRPEMTTI